MGNAAVVSEMSPRPLVQVICSPELTSFGWETAWNYRCLCVNCLIQSEKIPLLNLLI